MTRRAAHYQTLTRRDLSQRQRAVLELIAAGKTNGEIAEQLGISLDGAKWHVSEILGKLEVDSRESAAEWWRAQRGIGARMASAARAFVPGSWLKPAIAGGALGGLALGSVIVGLALNGGNSEDAAALPACNADEFTWSIEVAPSSTNPGGVDYALFANNALACQLDAVIGVTGYGATLDGGGGAFMFGFGDAVAVTIEKQHVTSQPAALIVGTAVNVCNSATGLMVVITTPEQSSFYAPTAMPVCEDPPRGAGFSAEWVANWKAKFSRSGTPVWWEAGLAPATPTPSGAVAFCDPASGNCTSTAIAGIRAYTVVSGDSIETIAGKFNLPVAVLSASNSGVDLSSLRPGMVLRIPNVEFAAPMATP